MPTGAATHEQYRTRLRLAVERALTNNAPSREVASVTGVSHTTVCLVRKKAHALGLDWPAIARMPMDAVYALVASPPTRRARRHEMPDFEYIHRLLQQPGVTREYLYKDYAQLYGERAYSYAHFCLLLKKHQQPQRATMKQLFEPGYRMEVDYSGKRPEYLNPKRERVPAELLCFCLPCSGYSFACVMPTQDVHHTIAGTLRAFAFFGGSAKVIVPDNLKAAVLVAGTEKLQLNPAFLLMAQAHQCAVLPARPYKPTHKGSVEQGVQRFQRYLLPELARKAYKSFEELSAEVDRLVAEYNDLPLSDVLLGTRSEEFEARERPALRPLPEPAFVHRHALDPIKVPPSYNLRILDNNYSVPFELVGQRVEPVLVNSTIEIWHAGDLVATHARLTGKGSYSMKPEHEKAAHRAQRSRDRNGIEAWAANIGPVTIAFIAQLFSNQAVSEQGLSSAQAVHSTCKNGEPEYIERVAKAAFEQRVSTATEFNRLFRLLRNEAFVDPSRPTLLRRRV